VNDLDVVIAPIDGDLSYKSSQILFVDTGVIAVHMCDAPDGSVNATLSSEKIHGQLSAETITASSSIVHRLFENVEKCKNDATLLITQSNIRMTYDGGRMGGPDRVGGAVGAAARRRGDRNKKKKKENKFSLSTLVPTVLAKVLSPSSPSSRLNLRLEASGQDLSVAFFGNVVKDAQWIQLTLSSYGLSLSVTNELAKVREEEGEDGEGAMRQVIVRELLAEVGDAVISRMVEDPKNPANNWVRFSRQDPILQFPASSLVMRTRQDMEGPHKRELDCWFVTEFGDTIQVTLQVELYAFLRELAMTLKVKLSTVFSDKNAALSDVSTTGTTSGGGGSSNLTSSTGGAGVVLRVKPPKPPVTASAHHMNVKAFLLEPKVNVLENLTPYALGKVFELLKIGDPGKMIPEAVNGAVVDGTEKLLFALKDAFILVDNFYNPPVVVPVSKATTNVPVLKIGGKTVVSNLKRASSNLSVVQQLKKEESPRSKSFMISASVLNTPTVSKLLGDEGSNGGNSGGGGGGSGTGGSGGDDLFSLLDEEFD
jgi:hypothetical protein